MAGSMAARRFMSRGRGGWPALRICIRIFLGIRDSGMGRSGFSVFGRVFAGLCIVFRRAWWVRALKNR